jgi:hypothetical protein
MNRLAAYMGTWSGSQRFRKETGRDALDEIRDELAAARGNSHKCEKSSGTCTCGLGKSVVAGRQVSAIKSD